MMKKIKVGLVASLMTVTLVGCGSNDSGKADKKEKKTVDEIKSELLTQPFLSVDLDGTRSIQIDMETNCQYIYINTYKEGGITPRNEMVDGEERQICSEEKTLKYVDKVAQSIFKEQ